MTKTNSLLLAALLSAAVLVLFACSSDGGNSNGGSNSDINVPTAGKSVDELLNNGVESLKLQKWDEAVAYYNAAYEKDSTDVRAIIYSTLASLAKISTDPKVASLMKDNFGFTDYPNRLNALFSNSWLKEYPERMEWNYYDRNIGASVSWYDEWDIEYYKLDKEGYYYRDYTNGEHTLVSTTPKYDTVSLPSVKTPNWVKGELYNETLISGKIFGADAWALSLIANLIDKNTAGLNNILDGVIDGVFGVSYNEAATKIKKLESNKSARITLDPYFIEELDLENVFDEYDSIGWAEVNAIVQMFALTKASLEWVASYDLNNDLSVMKYAWKGDSEDMLEHFKKVNPKNLPFNNGFLKARPGKMAVAKADFVSAIKGLQDSYTAIQNSGLYPKKVKESYSTINEGATKLIEAINGGTKFYIPENPTEGKWPVLNGENVAAVVDFGKFFTEGYLSLTNIFEVENGKPVFYLMGEKLTAANYADKMDACESFYDYDLDEDIDCSLELKLNIGYLKKLTSDSDVESDEYEFLFIGINADDAGKAVFEKYYK